MDIALQIALVAAAASLVGALISLAISRRTARAAREQAVMLDWLKEQRSAIDRIRTYAGEVESLRSACWIVLMLAERLTHSRLPKQDAFESLFEEFERFSSVFRNYWDNWRDAK